MPGFSYSEIIALINVTLVGSPPRDQQDQKAPAFQVTNHISAMHLVIGSILGATNRPTAESHADLIETW